MNLKFETIVQFFRKIIQLKAVIILKSANEYYWKIISKSCLKMDLYPAMNPDFKTNNQSRIKVHFEATFWDNFSIVFVSAFQNDDCI